MALDIEVKDVQIKSLTTQIRTNFPDCMDLRKHDVTVTTGFVNGENLSYVTSGKTAVVSSQAAGVLYINQISDPGTPFTIGEIITGDVAGDAVLNTDTDEEVGANADNTDTISTDILDKSLGSINNEVQDAINANKNYGLPCGASVTLIPADVQEAFEDKWDILNKMAAGSILDPIITTLTNALGSANCIDLSNDLKSSVTNLITRDAYMATVAPLLAQLNTLHEEVLGVLGSIGSALGCAEEMFDAVSTATPWLDEINNEYGTAMIAVKDAKALGGTPKQIYDNTLSQVNTDLNWDGQMTVLKTGISSLNTNFPT